MTPLCSRAFHLIAVLVLALSLAGCGLFGSNDDDDGGGDDGAFPEPPGRPSSVESPQVTGDSLAATRVRFQSTSVQT